MAAKSALPEGYKPVRKKFTKPTRCRQSEADQTDVNTIVARHQKTGVVNHLNGKPAMYGDFSQANDLKEALDLTMAAQEGFMELPAAVRRAAENDPRVMLEMLGSEEGTDVLVEAGLDIPFERTEKPEAVPFAKPSAGESGAPASEASSPQKSDTGGSAGAEGDS